MKTRKPFFWELYSSCIFLILVSLAAITWFSSAEIRDLSHKQTETCLLDRARFFSNIILPRLDPLDIHGIRELFGQGVREEKDTISVILPTGEIIADSRQNKIQLENRAFYLEVSEAISGRVRTVIRSGQTMDRQIMSLGFPIKINGEVAAVLHVSRDITRATRHVRTIQEEIVVCSIFITILAALACLYVSRRTAAKVRRMQKAALHLASGDLSIRLPVSGKDELSGLAEAINRMASQLDERMQTVVTQRNELEIILASMTEGIIALNTDDRVTNINQAGARMFGCNTAGAFNRSIQEFTRNPELNRFISRSLESEESQESDITIFGATERILHIRSAPLGDKISGRIGTLLVLSDVTQLRHLENMRRDFAANVSHEIKTPLTAIKGSVETLRSGGIKEPEAALRFLDIIERHVNRLSAIIEDLMRLSRIEREDLDFKKGRIRDLIRSAVLLLRQKAEEKQIRITIDCDENLAMVMDPLGIEQAFINLLDNAIKYSPSKSAIHISAEIVEKEIRIQFKDQGIGIAQAHIPRLFERFYRVDNARSRQMGGTGLGLAIVKHIIHAHKGRVEVESTAGRGSVFAICLPFNGVDAAS